jgi:hypothetical protein
MFNWVCPRCGRENSPSYTECPDCKERDLQAQAEEAAQHAAPVPVTVEQPYYQAPPQTQEWQVPYQPPQPPVYNAPPPQYVQAPPQQPQYVPPQQPPPQYQQPPQYAPPQQYAQPPQQYQQPPQAQPPQPQPQYAPPQQQQPPQYAPPQPQYNQTQPIYVQQPPQQYAPPQQYTPPPQPPQPQYTPPPQQQYSTPVPAPKPAPAPAPVEPPKPKPAYVAPRTPLPPEEPELSLGAKIAALPTLVLMLLFAVIFLLVGAGIYYGYQYFGKSGSSTTASVQPTAAAKAKSTNPMQKYIEVVGIRLTTDAKKKPIAKFVVVSHASTEVNGLSAIVTLWASTSRSEEDAVGSFAFSLENLGPYESKEVSAPFKTKLKMYELPDWQNATPEIQITSPQP